MGVGSGDKTEYRRPKPTVDVNIDVAGGIVLIERHNPSLGLPHAGRYVDTGAKRVTARRCET